MSSAMFRVKATYDYTSPHDEDLSFPLGQIINVTEEEDADWYVGEYIDNAGVAQKGLFPRNFVERFEPEAPPRPTRARTKKEDPAPPIDETTAIVETPIVEQQKPVEPTPQPPSKSTPAAKSGPPPVAKPKPNAFKDRIAAFNKPSTAPVPAAKPGAQSSDAAGSSYLIKKPFVAPPPARDSYVPLPRETNAPTKTYRRDEDPEIAARQAQDQDEAKKAGLAPTEGVEQDEDLPKATSLKDRIAMLQKQQQEAARRAEQPAQEKSKRPVTQRAESDDRASLAEDDDAERESVAQIKSSATPRQTSKPPAARQMSRDSRVPELPVRETFSDSNDADQSGAGETTEDVGESTEVDEIDDKALTHEPQSIEADTLTGDDDSEQPDQGEETEEDAEIRRKQELRERMAKMSGGMGMAGMFGAPGGIPMAPTPPKKKTSGDKKSPRALPELETSQPTQRVPVFPLPSSPRAVENRQIAVERETDFSPPMTATGPSTDLQDIEDLEQHPSAVSRAAPPIPNHAATESRPSRAPPSNDLDDDDDSLSDAGNVPLQKRVSATQKDTALGAPPVPPAGPRSPPVQDPSKRTSYMPSSVPVPLSPPSHAQKRTSRVPPIPSNSAMSPTDTSRPPPPPPPRPTPVMQASQEGITDVESDYEGDYDTDIASGATHKDALKAHARQSSADDGTLSDQASIRSSVSKTIGTAPPPPLAHRNLPPPPPPPGRSPMDAPRQPPRPPPRDLAIPQEEDDDDDEDDEEEEYDPYRYVGPPVIPGPARTDSDRIIQESDPSLYAVGPTQSTTQKHNVPPPLPPVHHAPPMPATDRAPPPPPPNLEQRVPPPPPPPAEPATAQRQSREMSRKSLEVPRTSTTLPRRSGEGMRPDQGIIAKDIDLGEASQWWTQPNTPPPAFQVRSDVLYEMEESSVPKRGGHTIVSRDVYVLFSDYSQTIVTARFNPKSPADVVLEQRHEEPPSKLRQDQLETAHTQFGGPIANAANSQQNTTVGDGTPQALVTHILRAAAPAALQPIGSRSYGALVYANMANASVQQHDEIRPGDIISFRNARLQGKHGAMHAKYSMDVGKPEHVGIVIDWDGTKRKVRAWEQGREGKKVKMESFRMNDLRSGEIKIWRVVGRDYVAWEGNS